MQRSYLAIDLKSFYASVECIARGLNPLTTNLVVADLSRTEKTICLAVTPALKAVGVPGRARLFEVIARVAEENERRRLRAPGRQLTGASCDARELEQNPSLALDYHVATPGMARYMEVSAQIYRTYLEFVAPEDIHVYSVDEVFMDLTQYLRLYQMDARTLAGQMIRAVLQKTGITATAGIGSNLYLAKVAMDIMAKRTAPDENGVRIAELDEKAYRRELWTHRPLTDFWRVGRGTAEKLEQKGIYTMGDVARCSVGGAEDFYNEDLLYRLFGVNAELLIDHAWGWESCTMADIKAYRPRSSSLSAGQVLPQAYDAQKAQLVVREMADAMALRLVGLGLATDQLTLTIGLEAARQGPAGERRQKYVHGAQRLPGHTASGRALAQAAQTLFARLAGRQELVRRFYLSANHLLQECAAEQADGGQLSFFPVPAQAQAEQEAAAQRERRIQLTLLELQRRYGKNAVLKGMNYLDGATARARNTQIGGHKA